MDELSSLPGHLMEPLVSILGHIIVYFDCDDTLKPQCAVDIQRFFQNSENFKFTSPLFMILQFKESMLLNAVKYKDDAVSSIIRGSKKTKDVSIRVVVTL
jgi:hypothetical protein